MKQTARALIGHMTREEAIQILAGGPATAAQSAKLEATWRAAVKAAHARAEYEAIDPRVNAPPLAQGMLTAFASRQDVQALLAPHQWSVGWADFSHGVLSYQRIVITEGTTARLRGVRRDDPETLIDLCLPPQSTAKFQGSFDQAQSAFTASSINPNLRVAGFQIANVEASGSPPEQLFGFKLTFGSSFVQIVEYRGRWMVRDGYHRVYGLMGLGITQIPCVVIKARTFEETGAGRPGFFGFELLYSSKPPTMNDFFSPASVDVQAQAVMRVIRLKAEEFVVPILEADEPAVDSAS